MSDDCTKIIEQLEHWVERALAAKWVAPAAAQTLLDNETSQPHDLFSSPDSRPLVVAFMGGTGVGKSSLLNKLAAQAIAKTGVERPTSREVTLYCHHTVSLQSLEQTFPVQQIKLSQHSEAVNQHIMWIDMPDVDSTEQKNETIVLQWLPFIDLLIYVVSPERYSDNKAWQLVLAKGANHAWVFAFNQWDQGELAQYQDFEQQLLRAGFNSPLIFKTACVEAAEDEFAQLQAAIATSASQKTIEQLELRTLAQRKHNIQRKLQSCLATLGEQLAFSALAEYQRAHWPQTQAVLVRGLQLSMQQTAKRLATEKIASNINLWDDWAQNRLDDHFDALIVVAAQQGLPTPPIREHSADCRSKAAKIVQAQTELSCRQALLNPGNIFHRGLLKTANFCEIVLPLMAMIAVGFQVFQGYYDGATANEDFLGLNFAVHSGLFVLISWLVPYFIVKKMQPSLEKTALRGLHNGFDKAMAMLNLELQQSLDSLQQQHHQTHTELKQLIHHCNPKTDHNTPDQPPTELSRMLLS